MSNTAGGPTTWFSGKSAPEDQRGPNPVLLFGLVFALYSPIGSLVAVGCYIAFNYYRVSHKVIAGAAALYTIPFLILVSLFSSLPAMIKGYNAPLGRLASAIKDKDASGFIAHNWWFWLTHQIGPSVALGLTVGALWTTWKWIRRPAWEDNERIPGPIHRLRRRRVINAIAADLNGPADGATLGVDPFGVRIVQTEAEAGAHTLTAGGSGSGKTTTMMIGIRDQIRKGEPVCVVDLKGAADVPAQLAEWSQRYGRRFLHWSITDRRVGYTGPADGPAFYDPIGRGDASRKKDLLIGSQKWDVEYYKSVNENYLQTAFQIAELVPNPQVDAFTDLAALLDMDKLKQRAAALFLHAPKTDAGVQHAAAHGMQSRWWEQYPTVLDPHIASVLSAAGDMLMKPEESERSAVRNMAARVQNMRQSTAGAWLKRDDEHGRDIDLRRVADEGWVVVFSLDSSNYEATSSQVGGLIIQDLKTLSAELRVKPAPKPFHVYVDEFSAIGSDNILGLLARARDARMPCTLSTQALADLKKADPVFLDQALGIVNCFIIHRTNKEEDAEIFAGLTGKKMVYKRRYGVEMTSGLPGGIGTGSATGQGHVELVEDYVVLPSEFQALERGHLVYIAKSPNARVIHPVTVIREDESKVAQAIATGAAPLVTVTPRYEPTSPFTDPDDDLDAALPSPWPVMASDLDADLPLDEPEPFKFDDSPTAPSDGFVPVPLHEAVPATESTTPSTLDMLSEFDTTPTQPTVETADPQPRPVKERATPIIDPALYRSDIPVAESAQPHPTPDIPASGPVDPVSPSTLPLAPVPIQNPASADAVASVPVTPAAPTDPVSPPTADEESVFGGGEVEWEDGAPSWDAAETRTPAHPAPRRPLASGLRAKVPTNTKTPSSPVMRADEWNE